MGRGAVGPFFCFVPKPQSEQGHVLLRGKRQHGPGSLLLIPSARPVPSACSPVCTPSAPPATRAGWSALPCAPPAAVQWGGSVKTTSSTTWWRRICCSTRTRGAARRTCAAWPPGTGSRRTCCSPRSGGPSPTRRGAPRTCWSCRTWTASPRTSGELRGCGAGGAVLTAPRTCWSGPLPRCDPVAQVPVMRLAHCPASCDSLFFFFVYVEYLFYYFVAYLYIFSSLLRYN